MQRSELFSAFTCTYSFTNALARQRPVGIGFYWTAQTRLDHNKTTGNYLRLRGSLLSQDFGAFATEMRVQNARQACRAEDRVFFFH